MNLQAIFSINGGGNIKVNLTLEQYKPFLKCINEGKTFKDKDTTFFINLKHVNYFCIHPQSETPLPQDEPPIKENTDNE